MSRVDQDQMPPNAVSDQGLHCHLSSNINNTSVGRRIDLFNPSLAEHDMPLANGVDPDQLASEEANWSGSALFVIKYVNFYQKPWSCNLIGWKLEVGMAS